MSVEGNTDYQQLHKLQEIISYRFSLLRSIIFTKLIPAFHIHCKKTLSKTIGLDDR